MKFQIGKYYQHGSGRVILIIGQANTFFHGAVLIAEEEVGNLIPVGTEEDAAQYWREVSGWRRYSYAGNNIPEPSEPLSRDANSGSNVSAHTQKERVRRSENTKNK